MTYHPSSELYRRSSFTCDVKLWRRGGIFPHPLTAPENKKEPGLDRAKIIQLESSAIALISRPLQTTTANDHIEPYLDRETRICDIK